MQIDWPGVAVAIVAGMAVAFVWYQKGPIADAWERLTGVTPARSRPARTRNMTQLLLAVTVTACGLGAAVSMARSATGDESVGMALLVGFAIQKTIGFRVKNEDEIAGIDTVVHGEEGYALAD